MESIPPVSNAPRTGQDSFANAPRTESNSAGDFPTLWREAKEAVAHDKANRAATGDLYFIRAGKAVKIGRTVNVVNRLRNMQANNHELIDCLVLLKDCGYQEKDWHEAFSDIRIRGEWFKLTYGLVRAMNEARDSLREPTDRIAQRGKA